MGAPPAVSAEWFPPEQRTTATAIATLFNTMGLAVSFLLGEFCPVCYSLISVECTESLHGSQLNKAVNCFHCY